ncbi:MAG: ATP synthase F1 subunit delta [Bryobacter sp.]|jgi:F-type H+-transporting ATPase subunit delta|nr:ATP synthase F1 subunit delta [Bryobacter sp. CoA8 C33]
MSEALAGRYATAFADILFAPNAPIGAEQALSELRGVDEMVAAAADLKHILNSPAVSRVRKRAVVAKLAEQTGISATTRNFLYVVIDRGRAALLPVLRKKVEDLVDARRGVARAQVATAAALSEQQKAALASELSRVTGKQVVCEFHWDPALLGGVVARIGSTVYDGSVRGKLTALKSRLSA